MSIRPIAFVAAVTMAAVLPTLAQAQGAPSRIWSAEIWAACTKEAKNWQKDVNGGSDTFRTYVFMSCANNGGKMPGTPMPPEWYGLSSTSHEN